MLAMIKRGFAVCCMAAVFGLGAADARKAPEAETAPKMKIAVLDFTCIDLVGQKLRLMKDKPFDTDNKVILRNTYRKSI